MIGSTAAQAFFDKVRALLPLPYPHLWSAMWASIRRVLGLSILATHSTAVGTAANCWNPTTLSRRSLGLARRIEDS
jgi:hypothetical protein